MGQAEHVRGPSGEFADLVIPIRRDRFFELRDRLRVVAVFHVQFAKAVEAAGMLPIFERPPNVFVCQRLFLPRLLANGRSVVIGQPGIGCLGRLHQRLGLSQINIAEGAQVGVDRVRFHAVFPERLISCIVMIQAPGNVGKHGNHNHPDHATHRRRMGRQPVAQRRGDGCGDEADDCN